MAAQDASQWLSVLLEILLKLCDIRESDLSLEPEVNRITSAPDVRKKKSNGLRRLKGPDVGTEEWGNLSDDLGGGSDSSAESEEYSSSESEEGAYYLHGMCAMFDLTISTYNLNPSVCTSSLLFRYFFSSQCDWLILDEIYL